MRSRDILSSENPIKGEEIEIIKLLLMGETIVVDDNEYRFVMKGSLMAEDIVGDSKIPQYAGMSGIYQKIYAYPNGVPSHTKANADSFRYALVAESIDGLFNLIRSMTFQEKFAVTSAPIIRKLVADREAGKPIAMSNQSNRNLILFSHADEGNAIKEGQAI